LETRPAITNDGDEARTGESDRNITRPKQMLIRGQEAGAGTRSSIVGHGWSEAIDDARESEHMNPRPWKRRKLSDRWDETAWPMMRSGPRSKPRAII
jgi:hypothetical protein